MKNIVIHLVICITLLGACISPQTPQSLAKLTASDFICLPVDDSTFYESKSIFQFEENTHEYISLLNEKSDYKIHLYNLEKQIIHKTIPIEQEGKNGIIQPNSIYPLTSNRFIITTGWGRFYIINGKGEIEQAFNLWKDEINFNTFDHISFISWTYKPAIIRDSILYFSQSALKAPRKKEDWKNIPMLAYVNLNTKNLGWSDLHFPLIFDEDEDKNFQTNYPAGMSYDDTGKELVVSMLEYDSIYVTSDFRHKKWYNAKSRYFPHIRPTMEDMSIDLYDMIRKKGKQPQYLHLMYDKYRNVFYRFALMPIENKQPFSSNPEQEFSIIILNHKYEIIGETRFPGNTYDFYMCFVGKKGLYISENNINNPNFDENKLVFRCFTLEEAVTD